MLLNILLVILVLDCIALVAVILLQQSEGGALGMGGGPTGMFTARGAGDLLTRTTQILAGVFFVLALLITLLSSYSQRTNSVTDRLKLDNLSPMAPPNPTGQTQTAPAPSSAPPPPLPGAAPAAPPLPTSAPLPTAARTPAPAAAVTPPEPTTRRTPVAAVRPARTAPAAALRPARTAPATSETATPSTAPSPATTPADPQ